MSISVELLEQYGNVKRSIGRTAVQYVRVLGIGPKQLIALRLIGKKKKCTMAEIAEGTNSDKASVTRVINTLVESGWLEREYGKEDRRQILISLTAKGIRNFAKVERIYGKIAEKFASSLDAKEQRELLRLLKKIELGLNPENLNEENEISLES